MSTRERRRAPRAPADFAVQLSPAQEGRPARVRDISEIGLRCLADEAVEEMTAVRVDLELPNRPGPHSVEGAVVRCEKTGENPGGYDVAIYFTQVGEHTRQALREYVAASLPT